MNNLANAKQKSSPVGGLFCLVALLLSGVEVLGQARATTPQVYSVPTTGEAARFRVPQVRLADAPAARRINATLTRLLLTTNLEDTTHAASAPQAIRRALAEYKANQQVGILGTGYEVLFNRKGLLSLALYWEYSGAYPYTVTRHVTFDTHTGRRLALANLLRDTLALRQQWYRRIEKRLLAYRRELVLGAASDTTEWAAICEYTGWDEAAQRLLPTAQPRLSEFALTPGGVIVYTNFFFPRMMQNLAPENDYLFTYSALAAWLTPGSLLAKVRNK